jgi:hypothetical protein
MVFESLRFAFPLLEYTRKSITAAASLAFLRIWWSLNAKKLSYKDIDIG